MKFTKVVDSEIRKVKLDDGTVYAIIGRVGDLLEKGVIYPDNTSDNLNKWLGIEKRGDVIREFDSLVEAKSFYRSLLTRNDMIF